MRSLWTFSHGAVLKLDPWDGDVFTARLVPQGDFAALVDNLGPGPVAFAQFQIDGSGALDMLRLTANDGQSYVLTRE